MFVPNFAMFRKNKMISTRGRPRKTCIICGPTTGVFYQFPADMQIRMKWFEAVEEFCDLSKINDYTVLCGDHFRSDDIQPSKRCTRLKKGAVPTIFGDLDRFEPPIDFNYTNGHANNETPVEAIFLTEAASVQVSTQSTAVQVEVISQKKIDDLKEECKLLHKELQIVNQKYGECLAKFRSLHEESLKNNKKPKQLKFCIKCEEEL